MAHEWVCINFCSNRESTLERGNVKDWIFFLEVVNRLSDLNIKTKKKPVFLAVGDHGHDLHLTFILPILFICWASTGYRRYNKEQSRLSPYAPLELIFWKKTQKQTNNTSSGVKCCGENSTLLVIQWLRLWAFTTGGTVLIPGLSMQDGHTQN